MKKKQKKKFPPIALTQTVWKKLPNVTKEEGFRTFGFTGTDRGLRVKKFHDGRINWYISYRFNEKPPSLPYYGFMDGKGAKHCRITIGTNKELDIFKARRIHQKFKDLIAHGINPKDMKNRNLDVDNVTVEELAEIYFTVLVQNNAKSIRAIKNMVKNNYSDIAKRYVDTITEAQIQTSIDRIVERNAMSVARNYQKYLRRMFDIAVDWKRFKMNDKKKLGFAIKENPVPKVEKQTKQQRQDAKTSRWLSYKEINLLVNDENIKLIDRLHIKLIITTGQRLTQIREATRDEIDLEDGFWLWKKERMKKYEPHDIPLTKLHIVIIKQAYEIVGNGTDYVFPAVRSLLKPIHDHTLPVAIADHQLRLGKTEGFYKAKHFRHTFKTQCAKMQLDRDWIDRVQHHSTEYGSAGDYDHYEYITEKRHVLEKWCDKMEEVFDPDWKAE